MSHPENDPEIQREEPFESHCVIELSAKCQEELVNWLIQRIMAPKSVGGAELVVRPVRDIATNHYRYLHVCAPFYRQMEIAEWLEMTKPDLSNHGALKAFTVKTLTKFVTDCKRQI
ncbi:hypothetical protein RvY_06114 [Ramazzottius varieornatus]|uniref:Uncharacterized protein n=1 Tax=Ramazzottius varieornatus TaxID=947166 RepID=A0A1D1UXG0_RAMVA|nr:hypothetical protein RvY_06114 [Ramazzottius varieornatus]